MNATLKNSLWALAAVSSILITESCGVKKMIKNAGSIQYEVKPNPLELHGDSIRISVNGLFPEKYFHKKAILTVTPVVRYAGNEKKLNNIILQGEKVTGNGQAIPYVAGGKYSLTDRFAYAPGMEKAEVFVQASVEYKKKSTPFGEAKVVDGTIVTPLLLRKDFMPVSAGDKFDKNPTVTQKANIYFVVDQWDVRPVELKSDEMSGFFSFIDREGKNGSRFEKMDIYGYASPEGELKRNAKLSENRADAAFTVVANKFKKNKLKDTLNKEGFYRKVTTNFEDWDGLKNMLQTGSVADKEQALNIINTIGDPEAREAEFRRIASYDPIYKEYFPKLRRAEINLSAKLKTRTDEQIKALALSSPDSLGMEELLYASSLFSSQDDKLRIYQAFSRLYPEDYRGFNNIGCVYIAQGKINEAKDEFEKAGRISANNPAIQNNLGVVAAMKGDKKGAAGYFESLSSKESTYNKANLAVANGKYQEAIAAYGDACTFNAALAKMLAGNLSGATQTLDCSPDKDSAIGSYLRAVIAARENQKDIAISALKKAFQAEPSLKDKAKQDLEFRAFKTDADFSSLLN
ncbi:MAG: hypothetical protein IT240_07220 [Bacteroidia bacterium]|nr:hypothetical protein [Bacteroidia bacterium]